MKLFYLLLCIMGVLANNLANRKSIISIPELNRNMQHIAEIKLITRVKEKYNSLKSIIQPNNMLSVHAQTGLSYFIKNSDSKNNSAKSVFLTFKKKNYKIKLAHLHHENNKFIIYNAIVSLFILSAIFFYFHMSMKKHKKLLKQNEFILQSKDMLTEELEKKINENKFNDLILLAKKNSPEFLILFKEVYPGFVLKLKEKDPKIRSSELAFCALAFLNFSTKDIAEYTFVTIRAVQIRKNRLRKKYNISSNEDFNSWMRRLGQ